LPDGLLSYQKSQFGYIFEGMENVCTFYDALEYFTATWCILWQFGTVFGHVVHFFLFWYVWTKKNLATPVWMLLKCT
jgi:hypothetical protein